MLMPVQEVLTLRDVYARRLDTYEASHKMADEQLLQQMLGRERILTVVIAQLSSITSHMEPGQVERRVVNLLNWLLSQKVCWMSGSRRRRSSHDQQKIWQIEGALVQIDAILPDLSGVLPPAWKSSPYQHGFAFQVFHSRDLHTTGFTRDKGVDIACQRWCGSEREQWYQEVAIVRLKQADDPLEKTFQLTNHIDQPWTRNAEVAWSLDMHALRQELMRRGLREMSHATGPAYPRSTSVGDIVVSLLSGWVWTVARFGFQVVAPDL